MIRWLMILCACTALIFGCDDDSSQAGPADGGADSDGLGDRDNDGILDGVDVCPDVSDPSQEDLDEDGEGDACDYDDDGDGVMDDADGCPRIPDPLRIDTDEDGLGDECDDDDDGDGVADADDLCPLNADDEGLDQDMDGRGDVCDFDIDGDELLNEEDNCPELANTMQLDSDADGLGDACDPDRDGDGIDDVEDNCPDEPNPEQGDADEDDVGDLCDGEFDGDGIENGLDNCPETANPDQLDTDEDGAGDACDACAFDADDDADEDSVCGDVDNCPAIPNTEQGNVDDDEYGNVCDPCPSDPGNDVDEDAVCASVDNCPEAANGDQLDDDLDGLGDACDACPFDADNDADADGVCGDVDICPLFENPAQTDLDGDGIGDACDLCPLDSGNDSDEDGICVCPPDAGNDDQGRPLCVRTDNCPEVANVSQSDEDGDGAGDACDDCVAGGPADPDEDAVCGEADVCPLVADPEQLDQDGDGLGDACDRCELDPENDIDGDGICGNVDVCPRRYDPAQADDDRDGEGNQCDQDQDNDGIVDAEDNCPLTANEDQNNGDGDLRGDACEVTYLREDFEDELVDWIPGNGGNEGNAEGWTTHEEAAYEGELGLTDTPGISIRNVRRWIDTPEMSFVRAERPRLVFWARLHLESHNAEGFRIKVMAPDGREVMDKAISEYGFTGVGYRRYEVDLSEAAGEPIVRIRFWYRTTNTLCQGIKLDNVIIDERPEYASHTLPFSDDMETLDNWTVSAGRWAASDDANSGDWSQRLSMQETTHDGDSVLDLKAPVDLRGTRRPRMSFWMRHAEFSNQRHLAVEMIPSSRRNHVVISVIPMPAGGDPYYQKYIVELDPVIEDPAAQIRFRYVHWDNATSWVTIDGVEFYDDFDRVVHPTPLSFDGDAPEIIEESGGWERVEEPAGTPVLRTGNGGVAHDSNLGASIGNVDFSELDAPVLSIWVRYELRNHRQTFWVEAESRQTELQRFNLPETVGGVQNGMPDRINGNIERIDLPLDAYAGDDAVAIRFGLTTLDDSLAGVDIIRIAIAEAASPEADVAPLNFDFDPVSPDFEVLSGDWSLSPSGGTRGTQALRLVTRPTFRGRSGQHLLKFENPIDISGLDRPRLAFQLRYLENPANHSLSVVVSAPGYPSEMHLIQKGLAGGVSETDGFQRVELPIGTFTGAEAVRMEWRVSMWGPGTVDLSIDDIAIEETPAIPPATLHVDGKNSHVIYVNETEVGGGSGWLAGEISYADLEIGENLLAIETEGPGEGGRMIASMRYGNLLIRTGEPGWVSNQYIPPEIPIDDGVNGPGEIIDLNEGWNAFGFDDLPWLGVATDGNLARAAGAFLLYPLNLGSKVVRNRDGGEIQYFRRSFTIEDTDGDGIPDPVDMCPELDSGAERDSNGNGIGDSCDECPTCRNVAQNLSPTTSGVRGDNWHYRGFMATDGSTWKGWQNNGPTGWLELDLGSSHRVCSVRWYNTADNGDYNAGTLAWNIQVRAEGGDWIEIDRGDLGDSAPAELGRTVAIPGCSVVQYVRFNVDRQYGGHAGISELKVFGAPLGP